MNRLDAPEALQTVLAYAEAHPDRYTLEVYPPQDPHPLLGDLGPQKGWTVGTERWSVSIFRSAQGVWCYLATDDEGDAVRVAGTGFDSLLEWIEGDPSGVGVLHDLRLKVWNEDR